MAGNPVGSQTFHLSIALYSHFENAANNAMRIAEEPGGERTVFSHLAALCLSWKCCQGSVPPGNLPGSLEAGWALCPLITHCVMLSLSKGSQKVDKLNSTIKKGAPKETRFANVNVLAPYGNMY